MEFYYAQSIRYSYQYPDLEMILKAESSSTPPPRRNQWVYLVAVLATLGLASLGFCANLPNLDQASQDIQKDIHDDYVLFPNR